MYNKNFSKEPTEKQKIGQIGEDCAVKYLLNNGFEVLDRNFLKKWGELDIVAKKGKMLHFIEVKSATKDLGKVGEVTHVTSKDGEYRAEDNMHTWKLKRLSRAVESYLLEKDVPEDMDWQFDLATVYIDVKRHISRVFLLEDIVL